MKKSLDDLWNETVITPEVGGDEFDSKSALEDLSAMMGGQREITPVKPDRHGFGTGIKSSIESKPEMFGQGIEAAGDVTGIGLLKRFGQKIQDSATDTPIQTMRLSDVKSPGDFFTQFLPEIAGLGVGSLATSVASGLIGTGVGTVAGAAIGKTPQSAALGATIGGGVGAASDALPSNIGELRQALIQEGVDEKEASKHAMIWGSVLSIPDVAVVGKALEKFGVFGSTKDQIRDQVIKKIKAEIAEKQYKEALKSGLTQTGKDLRDIALMEGGTEVGQTLGQQAVVSNVADKPFLTKENAEEVFVSGLAGMFGGGAVAIPATAANVALTRRRAISGQGNPPPQDNGAPPPTRDDLAAALEGGGEQPINVEIITPEQAAAEMGGGIVVTVPMTIMDGTIPTQGGDFGPGDTIQQVNRFGETVTGTVDSIQTSPAGRTIEIFDPKTGVSQIIFESDGPVSVVAKAGPPIPTRDDLARQMDQQAQEAPAPPRMTAPEPAPAPSAPALPPKPAEKQGPPTFKDALMSMPDERVLGYLRGKNVRDRKLALEEMKFRYPHRNFEKEMQVEQAASAVDTAPTEAQKEAGNYQKGHVSVAGLPLSIENPKGSARRGVDQNGQPWEVTMPVHYGYVKGTEGADGDHVDVFLGDNPQSDSVFIVDQIDADTGDFDEHKAMLGFDNIQQAMDAYDQSFSDGKAEYRVGGVTIMSMAEFKDWLKTKDTTKPISYTESKTDPSKSYRIESPISGEARDVNVIGDEKRGYAIVDGINIIDITAMIKAGFSIERAIAQSLSTDPESLSAKKPKPEPAQETQNTAAAEAQNTPQQPDRADGATAEQDAPAAPQRGTVGMRLGQGDTVLTNTGRTTTPFPKIGLGSPRAVTITVKNVEKWLMSNALAEAQARGDEFNAQQFEANMAKPSQADKDSAEYYLFDPDFVFENPPSVLKDVTPAQPETPSSENTPTLEEDSNVGVPEQQAADNNEQSDDADDLLVEPPEGGISRDAAIELQRVLFHNGLSYIDRQIKTLSPKARNNSFDRDTKYLFNLLHQVRNAILAAENAQQSDGAETSPPVQEPGNVQKPESGGGEAIDEAVAIRSRINAAEANLTEAEKYLKYVKKSIPEAVESAQRKVDDLKSELADIVRQHPEYAHFVKHDLSPAAETPPLQDDLSPSDAPAQADGGTDQTKPDKKGPSGERGKKLKDVGEKMEGKRAFQDRMKKAKASEQAKQIIAATRAKEVFSIAKREGQTDGTARFAQALVSEIMDFSAYLKKHTDIIKDGSRRRGSTYKMPGWEDQVKLIFAENPDKDFQGRIRIGSWLYTQDQLEEYRTRIIGLAEDYIEFGSRVSDMFAYADTVEEFKLELKNALEDGEFMKLFTRFSAKGGLSYDVFSSASWSKFGQINDESEVREVKRATPMIRPKLEQITRDGLPDRRKGRDVTPEEFKDTFGFRGVEFGEWVNAGEGQAHLNHAYDALLDMAERLKIAPQHISLGGKLGFAFGSRGGGEHAAHFEPDNNVINLTKTKGDGSVAHEWLHALDHALRKNDARSKALMDLAYMSLEREIRIDIKGMVSEFLTERRAFYRKNKRMDYGAVGSARIYLERLIKSADNPDYYAKTSYKQEGDALGDYWGSGKELLARAWEAFILDTLDGKSPYLVSDWASDGLVTKDAGYRGTPYPTGEERAGFNAFFDEFLKLLDFSDVGVRFKDGAKLPIEQEFDKIVNEAQSYLPKLAEMLQEAKNGTVQQDSVQAGVSGGDGAASAEGLPGTGTDEDIERLFGRGRGGSAADVRSDRAESQGEAGDGRGSAVRGDGDRVRGDDTVLAPESAEDALPVFNAKGENHVIPLGALDEKRSQRQKAKDNIEIIKLVKQIEAEDRAATPEEQQLLAKYTGWGSVKNAFPDSTGQLKDDWKDIGNEVKELLTEKEYREARRTIQYAHYTSEIVVRSMWQAMERFGLKSGTVFEPGMGIGNFAGMMPQGLKLSYSGLEYDSMTARIARILYPQSGIRHADFTSARYADNMFDAAIGNPPFSSMKVKGDPKYKDLSLHNYFFAKSIDMVAPGGVVAFVTSRYSMDTIDSAARNLMAAKADLIGAIRLPDTAFKTNAHTEVVTDIIFLRKRLPGEESNGTKWMEVKNLDLSDKDGNPFAVNEYFIDHPEMVLGNFSSEGSMYAEGTLTVSPVENADLRQQLEEAIARLPENVISEVQKADVSHIDMDVAGKEDGSYYMNGDVLMQVDGGQGFPVQMRGKGAGGITKADAEKIKALIPVRDALNRVMAAMVERDDTAMKTAQKELKKQHSAFTKKYGPITKSETETRPPSIGQIEEARDEMRADYLAADEEFNEGDIDLSSLLNKINPDTGKKYTPSQIAAIRKQRREEIEAKGGVVDEGDFNPEDVPENVTIRYPNLDPFKGDPGYHKLMILENYNEETGEAKTTDVFEKNIIAEVKKPQIKTAVDALNYSLSTRNDVDIDMMARELGVNGEAVIEELEQLDLIYKLPDPATGKIVYVYSEEYLSGYVKDKLAFAKRLAASDPSYARNVAALEAVQPPDIEASRINTQLGSPYFEPKVIEDFMRQELNIPVSITYTKLLNNWEVAAHDPRAPENVNQYGTDKRSASEIMERLLMRKDLKVTRKTVDPVTGKDKQVVDVEATQAANDKAKILQEKFDQWIWKSNHAERVHRKYNDEYNNVVPRKFDGEHVTTAISPLAVPKGLRKHQKNVIWRVLQTGNTYIAHAVGAGKTLEMIASAMEMRRLGQWKKPMFVVPNHMLAQFSKEFMEAYPQARIMVADERNFHVDRRKRFITSVAKADLDAVIITFSAFNKVPVSSNFEIEVTERELDKYRAALVEAGGKKSRGSSAAAIEKKIQAMEARLNALKADKDNAFTFEELGVDALLIDEAHNFRKLSFTTMQGTMKGVNPVGSKMSWDLYMKSRYLERINPGRGLVLASGTPLTNTLAEIFTIQRYMNERELERNGLHNFDAWSSVFAASVTNPERQPSGAYKNVTRLAEFRNLGVLSQMINMFMDTVTSDELGALVDRPTLKSGSMIIRTTKPTRQYLAFQKYLEHRTNEIAKSSRKNVKGADNILTIIGEGRKAAVDMRMIDPTLPEMPSKLEDMIENIFEVWKRTSDDTFKNKYSGDDTPAPLKGGVQLVFSDLGVQSITKNGKTFSAYDHIKRKLVKNGIPAGQVAFIADYDTFIKKIQLQFKLRKGEIRVLIGSTAKMGTGLNVQNRLKAIHNLDAPWLPADLEQRIGRGLRQGNQYKEIEVYGYGTEGSYDSTMWGMLETKAKAIIQFLKGDRSMTSMRDIEETDHFRMAKAMTSGDPRVLKQAELMSEVEKLSRQSKNFRNEQVRIKSDIASKESGIEYHQQRISSLTKAQEKRKAPADGEFLMTVAGKPYAERAEAAAALETAVKGMVASKTDTPSGGVKIGELQGFDLHMFIGMGNLGTSYEIFLNDPAFGSDDAKRWTESADTGISASGTITTLLNALNRMEKNKEKSQSTIESNKREIGVLKSQIADAFPKEAELAEKQKQLQEIEADLQANAPVEVVYDDYPVDYWQANKEAMKGGAMFSLVGADEYFYAPAKKKTQSQKQKIENAVNRAARKGGFPEANITVYKDMDYYDGHEIDELTEGFFHRGLIFIAMTSRDAVSTLNHELVHALRAAGAFSKPEWAMMMSKAAEWRRKYNIDETYREKNLSESQLNEEAVAHALQDYAQKGFLSRIRHKIARFLNIIREVLTGKPFEYTTPEQVFEAALSGEVAGRVDFAQKLEELKTAERKFANMESRPMRSLSGKEKTDTTNADFKSSGDLIDEATKSLIEKAKAKGWTVSPVDKSKNRNGDRSNYFRIGNSNISSSIRLSDHDANFNFKTDGVWIVGRSKESLEDQIDMFIDSFSKAVVTEQAESEKAIALRNNTDFMQEYRAYKKAKRRLSEFKADKRRLELEEKYGIERGKLRSKTYASVLDGQQGEDGNLPMYSLSKDKKQALDQAKDALMDVRGMDSGFRPALNKIASYMLHPHQIASLYKSFTPVYLAAIEMMKNRDVIVHDLSNHMDLYNKIDRAAKKRIDAVLEIGRLTGANFAADSNGNIEVTNPGIKTTLHSKTGEIITLSGAEVDAYLGVRKAMDLALDTYMQTVFEEYGLAEKGIDSKEKLIVAMKSSSNERETARLQEVLKIIQDIEAAKKMGYIPLKRWGEIGVTVRSLKEKDENGKGKLAHFERIELPKLGRKKTIGENKAVQESVAELLKQYPAGEYEIETFEIKDFTTLRAKLNMNELDVLAASSDMTQADYDILRDMLSDAIARRGFRAHFFHSSDVPGYSGDFERALNDYVVSIAGHLSRRKHMPRLDKAVQAIEKAGEVSLFDYARKYVSYITEPKEEFGALRQMGFMWYLAGNIASGVTNATQPLMVTAPWFKAMFSHSQIAGQMGRAYTDTVKMFSLGAGTDILDFAKAPDDVKAAMDRANAQGYFLPLNTFDAMAIANTNVAYLRGLDSKMRQIQDVLSVTFSGPERINRVVTFISAYRFAIDPNNRAKIMAFVARDQLGRKSLEGKTGVAFAEAFADYAVMSTQLRMGKLNRPELARGVGTLPFQFMSFSMQMFELMHRLALVHGGQKGTALAMMIFAVVAMSGIKGFPLEDDLQKMFEAAWKTLTRKDIDIDSAMLKVLEPVVGNRMALAIMKGLPFAYANVDMSGRLGYGNIVPDTQADLLGIWYDMIVVKPSQAAVSLARGDFVQALADVSPAVLRNVAQAYAWSQGGVRSGKTGDTIIPPEALDATDIGLKALGFTSGDIAAERARIFAEQRASHAVDALRSDYYDRLARAYAAMNRLPKGEKEKAAQYEAQIEAIWAEIARHNEKAPMSKQIIINVKTSLRKRIQEEMIGASANKARKQAREESEALKEVWKR